MNCIARTASRRRLDSAFTLIELVISTALIALVLTGAYACLNAGISSQKIIEPRTDILQSARVALAIISADLRCACPLPKGAAFLGVRRQIGDAAADNLDFATHNYTPRRPGEGDFCELSLFLDRDPETGTLTLFRRRNPTLAFDPLSGGVREELVSGVAGLQFEYYDGWDWFDSWGDPQAGSLKSEVSTPKPNEIGLPEAVRITLSFAARPATANPSEEVPAVPEPPLTFQTIVRINIPSSGSPSIGNSASPNPTSSAPAPGDGPPTP